MGNYGNYTVDPVEAIDRANFSMLKRQAVLSVITETSALMMALAKKMPNNGKRNPFNKSYSRRPGSDKKRSAIMAQLSISAKLAEARIRMIQAQPLPSPEFARGAAIVGSTSNEIVVLQK